jgi:hypothetical protein
MAAGRDSSKPGATLPREGRTRARVGDEIRGNQYEPSMFQDDLGFSKELFFGRQDHPLVQRYDVTRSL